ncbi:ExbD/TolR family protein [Candidatus Latescibacterota bacterium]
MKRSKFRSKRRIEHGIPTGTMADISFLLIIFFMVTTVFVVYRGFPVDLPDAERVDRVRSRRNSVNVWIGSSGRIMVDEYDTDLAYVGNIVRNKLVENPRVLVLVKSDRNTPYRYISGVIEQLKQAEALRVSFIALKE